MESISSRVRMSPRPASVQCVKRMREMALDAYEFDNASQKKVEIPTPGFMRIEVTGSERRVYSLRSKA